MRKFKKVLAVVLAVMTLCSAMPFTAFAAENDPGQPIVTIDEVPGQDNADMADENSQAPPTSGEDEDVSAPVVTETPAPTVEPTASPEASPSAAPATSEEVSPSAEPTATAEPSATDEPTVTDEPSASPSPAPEETADPETVSTPEPSAEPTAPPSAEPTEQPEENPGPYLGEYSVLEAGDPDAAYAWPVPEAYTITQGFGGDHHGWDIAADLGTPVTAAAAGTVVQTYTWDGNVTKGDTNAYGNMVLLRHADGSMTRYAHLSEYYVQEGDEVVQGQEIGAVGSTGDSTGPHLHFEIIENATRVDPAEFGYFEAGIVPVEAEFDTNSEAEYILAHADPAYVGTGDKAQPFDFMRVAFTLADRSMFDHNPTLDDMWTVDEDGDGISDNWMAALGQFEAYKFLYEVSPDSDYYVAWADAGFSNAVVTDWLAGNSNAGLAELYDDVVYDAEAGLVYVPKSYTTAATEGAAGLGHVRLQVLYAVNDAEDLSTLDTEVSVTVNTSIADNTVTDSTTAQVSAISSYVEVDLGAYKNVSGVSVNGLELDKSEYEFDSGSGQLTINKTAATINTIDVDVEDVSPNANNGIATIAASGRITDADIKAALGDSWANQLHSLGLFEFDGVPVNGSAYIIPATNTGYDHNDNSEGRPGYVKPCLDAYVSGQSLGTEEEPEDMARFLWTNTWRSQASYGGFPWGGFNDNGYSAAGASEGLQRYATLVARSNLNITPTTVASSTRSEVKLLAIPSVSLDLFCAHLGISSSYNDYNGGFNQTSQDGASDPLFMRILYSEYDAAKGTGMAIVAVGLATVETQAGIGYFAINFKAEIEKKVTFQKTSANPSMTNGNSNYSLAGAVYRLYNSRADAENNRNIVTEFRTDSTGKATGTIPGWKTYWAKEITAPKGYVLDPVPFQVTFSQASPSVTHADQPGKFTLRIQKVDKKTGQPKAPGNATLAGAVFQLIKEDGTTVNLPATNTAGQTSISDLAFGTYQIKEITAPPGYTRDSNLKSVTVSSSDWSSLDRPVNYTKDVTIDEERQEYYIRIGKKYEAVTASGVVQKPEVGARFEVYLTSKGSYAACADEERDILTIGSDGTATSKALVHGNYTVRQLDDDNKALDKTAPFTVNAVSTENLHTYSYDFVNHIPYGIIKIHKTATDGAVSGLKFKITRVQDGWTKTYNTDSTGWITTENLPVFTDPQGKIYANYRIEEVDTPPRYVTPDPVVVNLSRGTVSDPIPVKTVNVDNIVKQFQVDVVKEDLDSKGLPQGDATLAGAVYGVYLNGALLDRYTTDADGRFTTKTYDCGTGYTIQEITPSKGYLLDSTVYTLDTAASSQTQALRTLSVTSHETVIRGGVEVKKNDASTGDSSQGDGSLKGIKFVVSNESDHDVRVTGTQWTGGAQTEGTVKATGEQVYAPGEDILVLVTDELGVAKTAANNVLPYGTYEIREVRSDWTIGNEGSSIYANEAYLWSAVNVHTFKILENGRPVFLVNSDNNGGTFTAVNEVLRGSVQVQKYDLGNNNATPQGDASLAGIVFTVKNTSDKPVYLPQGTPGLLTAGKTTVIYRGVTSYVFTPGDDILTITTNASGVATSSSVLPYGTYTVRETKTNDSMLLTDSSEHEFEIRENATVVTKGTNGDDLTYGLIVKDEVVRGGVKVEKDDANIADDTQGNGSLKGIKFVVSNESEHAVRVTGTQWTGGAQTEGTVKATGEQVYAPGEDILVLVTNEQGIAQTALSNVLPYGTYKIREVRMDWTTASEGTSAYANTSYMYSADNEHTFKVLKNGTTVFLSESDNNGGTFKAVNEILRGGLEIEKRDAETRKQKAQGGATLKDTEFEIVNKSTKAVFIDVDGNGTMEKYDVDSKILSIFTDEEGKASLPADFLPKGTYEIREVKASTGYLLSDDLPRQFTISFNGQIQEYKGEPTSGKTGLEQDGAWFNHPIRGDVLFVKERDADNRHLEDIPFLLISTTTGEQHILVSDENGQVNTAASWNPHTQDTNKNDSLYDETGMTWSEHPDHEAGVWFGEGAPDDTVGALLYDTYIIRELPYETSWDGTPFKEQDPNGGNKGMRLWTDTVTMHRNGLEWDMGTVRNRAKPRVSMWTTATDKFDDDKLAYGYYNTTISDKVEVVADQGLAGIELRIEGVLMDKATGEPVLVNGEKVTATKEFIPHSNTFTETLDYTFDARQLDGHDVVVFENLYEVDSGEQLATHEDIEDVDQTVHIIVPGLDSSAYNGEEQPDISSRTKIVVADTHSTITDEVYLTGLIPGQNYTLRSVIINDSYEDNIPTPAVFDGRTMEEHWQDGTADRVEALMMEIFADWGIPYNNNFVNPTTGMWFDLPAVVDEPAIDRALDRYEDVLDVMAWDHSNFVATSDKMTVTTSFEDLNTVAKRGQNLRCFQILTSGNTLLATEVVSQYEAETVNVIAPTIGTTATVEGLHIADPMDTVTLEDVVSYENVIPGNEYVLKGILMDKATGEPLLIDGKEITGETTFTPTEATGSTKVLFTFKATGLAGKSVVAFETLYREGYELTVHADIEDEGQTVTFEKPEIHTTATSEDGTKETDPLGKVTLKDSVHYTGLIPGHQYKVTGKLMDKDTGEAVVVDGQEITSAAIFTASASEGSVDVTFVFDASGLHDHQVVVFEDLYRDTTHLAVHADIEDEDQTVRVRKPEIGTTATVEGGKAVDAFKSVTLTDTVAYKDLTPGKEYTLTGKLMDKSTGKPLLVNGKEVTSEATFTATAENGSTDVTFTFDARGLQGHELVVFEELYREGTQLAVHADIEDKDQTIRVRKPELGTTATVEDAKETDAYTKVVLEDVVKYTDLTPGKTYTVTGVLMDKASGKALLVDGKEVTSEATFTAASENGSVTVTFTFDGRGLQGHEIVAFETLYREDVELAVHADIEDENQTVRVRKPEIGTTATVEGAKEVDAFKSVTLVDVVKYTDLTPGKTYTMSGVLMDKVTGKALLVNGKEVTAETTFTPVGEAGSIEVTFVFDATGLQGHELVVFENLYRDDAELAVHADIEDKDQTIRVRNPEIGTTATADDGEKEVDPLKEITLLDVVKYTDLTPGKTYTMTGVLMDKATGKALLVDGKEVTASTQFTAETTDGSVEVTFVFDASALHGHDVVAFESVYREDVELAIHADIEDESQTVHVRNPEIGTTATADEGEKEVDPLKEITLIDVVEYTDLTPGRTYTMTGVLMDKATGEALLVDGKEVTASTTFTAETTDGSVEVTFVFDASALRGHDIVAFESLVRNNTELAVHTDIEDKDQTVHVREPEIGTTATVDDGTKDVDPLKKITLIDTVEYSDLTPGKEYTVTGVLMDKATGEAIRNGDKEVTASATFTPEAADGTVDVTFVFDGSNLHGHDIVAFETLSREDTELAVHADIEDENQTVHVHNPEIGTTATVEDGEKDVDPLKKITLIDTVEYSDLTPGKEYTVTGVLMDKATGEAIRNGDKEVTASATFTPEAANGTVDVTFVFDASDLHGHDVVAFETLTREDTELAVHADIEDENQTVHVHNPEIGTTATVDEGEKEVDPLKEITLIDTVEYSDLTPGKEYTVTGVLMDKATGEAIRNGDKEVTASATFTTEAADGSVDVTFVFDASNLHGHDVVAFETLTREDTELVVHTDIEDENQTVHVHNPEIGTTATVDDGAKDVDPLKEITLIDTVEYSDLTPGKEYTVIGVLMDKATGEALLVDGKEVTASATFTPEEANGTVDVTFVFDASNLHGHDVVAFETLTREDTELAVHTDIEDENQTVHVHNPEIGTTATVEGEKLVRPKGTITLTDVVAYSDLTPGKEYTVTGVLMDKSTGEALLIDGKEVTASTTFVAEEANGTVNVVFEFEGKGLVKKKVVVFESLYHEDTELAVHADIDDDNQTVTFKPNDGRLSISRGNLPGTPNTGDREPFLPWLCAFVASAVVLLGMIFAARKRKLAKQLMSLALVVIAVAAMMLPMYANADEVAQPITETLQVEAATEDEAKAAGSFEEQIAVDGTIYALAGVEAELESSRAVVEEKTVEKTEEMTVGEKNAEFDQTMTKDGVEYRLSDVSYDSVQEDGYHVPSITETVDLGIAETEPEAEPSITKTYHIDEYDKDVEMTLPLVDVVRGDPIWVDDVALPMTIIGMDADQLAFDGGYVAFDGTTPPLEGNEELFLRYLGLDVNGYNLTSAEWIGEEYENEDGEYCRDAVVYGNRVTYPYTAVYGGEDLLVPAFEVYKATATYSAEVEEETGEQINTYQLTATYNPLEEVEEDHIPTGLIVAGAAVGVVLLAALIAVILFILSRKRRKEDENR